jgi:hypothetical protein
MMLAKGRVRWGRRVGARLVLCEALVREAHKHGQVPDRGKVARGGHEGRSRGEVTRGGHEGRSRGEVTRKGHAGGGARCIDEHAAILKHRGIDLERRGPHGQHHVPLAAVRGAREARGRGASGPRPPPPPPSRTNWTRLVRSSRTNWMRLVRAPARTAGAGKDSAPAAFTLWAQPRVCEGRQGGARRAPVGDSRLPVPCCACNLHELAGGLELPALHVEDEGLVLEVCYAGCRGRCREGRLNLAATAGPRRVRLVREEGRGVSS